MSKSGNIKFTQKIYFQRYNILNTEMNKPKRSVQVEVSSRTVLIYALLNPIHITEVNLKGIPLQQARAVFRRIDHVINELSNNTRPYHY